MAGESPDRSERERSSGETTEDTDSVPPARRRDPRESYAAPGRAEEPTDSEDSGDAVAAAEEPEGDAAPDETESAGDARLRDAVAAWVSASAPEDATTDAAGATDTDDAPEDDGEGGGDVRSELPVRPRKAAAPAEPAGTDTPTTMFGAVRREETASEKESAASRAERMTTAFFGASRKRDADAEEADTDPADVAESGEGQGVSDGDGPVADAEEPAGGSGTPAGTDGEDRSPSTEDAPADESDAEAPGGPEAGDAAADVPAEERAELPEDAADAASTSENGGKDQATAVFRAVAPESAAGKTDQPTTAIRLPKGSDAGATPASDAGEEKTGEEKTGEAKTGSAKPAAPAIGATGSGAEKPGPQKPSTADDGDRASQVDAEPEGPKSADAKTDGPAAGEAPAAKEKPQDAAPEAGAKPDGAKAAEPGASRFVPLRSADETRLPGPLPAAEPTGVGGEQERTKTQPVPDPQPLELLAQLTNTPPPPETPLRTAVRRVKIWTPLVVLLAIVFVVVQAVRPLPEPELMLTADPAYTFDGAKPSLPWPAEGQAYVEVTGIGVLGSSGEQKPVPIGSVAKTMTAYVVLQEHPLKEGEDGPTITIDKKAEEGGKRGAGNGDESVLDGVRAGDTLSLREAISALMIPSANNIARLLARWDSGSEAAFVDKMNATAEELGMADTTYTDPSGLQESTVSTAADQVKLGKKVVQLPELMSITRLPYWKNPFTGEQMRNWNALVPFDGAIGIKTGTTTAAGGNLLFAGYRDVGGTRQFIVGAVLGQHKPPIIDTVNAVSRELLNAAGNTLTSERIVRKGDVVGYLDDGLGGRTPVVATENVEAVGYPGVRVELGLEPGDDGMPHAAPAGEEVGVLTVGGGPGRVEVPVALQKKLTEPGFGDKLTRIL